jgi:hypothetical protein
MSNDKSWAIAHLARVYQERPKLSGHEQPLKPRCFLSVSNGLFDYWVRGEALAAAYFGGSNDAIGQDYNTKEKIMFQLLGRKARRIT